MAGFLAAAALFANAVVDTSFEVTARAAAAGNLEGAIADQLTQWPTGFDPAAHRVRVMR